MNASALDATGERVLIIDDEESVCTAIRAILERVGYSITVASSGEDGLQQAEEMPFDIILCDLKMPGMDGLEVIKSLQERGFPGTTIMMSAFGTASIALDAIRLGAYDYLAKPFDAEHLLLTLRKALERQRLRVENQDLREQVLRRYSFSNIVAKSPSMLEIFETIKKIADYKTTVLISGESGTGKELVAQAIHYNSPRRNKRFVAINCGAIPENLLESELFGHRKGSFTDATRDKKGLFEEAQGGTILLDEIGELPLHLQVKLLRVLQENEIRPVGESRTIPIDVRVIAATLRDLEQDVLDGRFRDDLFYRLNVVSIRIPPLRERRDDIPLLAESFLKRNQTRLGLPVRGISREALRVLVEHDWRGNVRELENCIERAMILTEQDEITVESLPQTVKVRSARSSAAKDVSTPSITFANDSLSIKVQTRILEEDLIQRALEQTKGNRTHAAKLLEISHRTLLYKLKEYHLSDASDDDDVEAADGEQTDTSSA